MMTETRNPTTRVDLLWLQLFLGDFVLRTHCCAMSAKLVALAALAVIAILSLGLGLGLGVGLKTSPSTLCKALADAIAANLDEGLLQDKVKEGFEQDLAAVGLLGLAVVEASPARVDEAACEQTTPAVVSTSPSRSPACSRTLSTRRAHRRSCATPLRSGRALCRRATSRSAWRLGR